MDVWVRLPARPPDAWQGEGEDADRHTPEVFPSFTRSNNPCDNVTEVTAVRESQRIATRGTFFSVED